MVDLLAALLAGDRAGVSDRLTDPAVVIEENGRRPLSIAAERGDLPMINLLVELGVPLDAGDATPLGYPALATALHHAASNGAMTLIDRLLAAGARPGLQNGIGYAPLHAACDARRVDAVRTLLTAGADPDPVDDYGFSPLHGAAVQGSTQCARLLIDAGADRTRRTLGGYDKVTPGMTPADAAAAYGHDDLVAILR